MIDGLAVVDAHMHVPRLSTVSAAWMDWAVRYGQDSGWQQAFGPDGDPVPARLDALLAGEGVDAALLFAEYSRVDGDDMYPVYELCAARGVPVIVHTGGSIFPGSRREAGDPKLMATIVADFPGVAFVLAHGGRGPWG